MRSSCDAFYSTYCPEDFHASAISAGSRIEGGECCYPSVGIGLHASRRHRPPLPVRIQPGVALVAMDRCESLNGSLPYRSITKKGNMCALLIARNGLPLLALALSTYHCVLAGSVSAHVSGLSYLPLCCDHPQQTSPHPASLRARISEFPSSQRPLFQALIEPEH